MSSEVVAALIAGGISAVGLIVSYIVTLQTHRHERQLRSLEQRVEEERFRAELGAKREELEKNLLTEEQRWQESFRAELRRNLVQESTLEIVRRRIPLYAEVWKALKVTANHEWQRLEDKQGAVEQLADYFTNIAYSETGLVMSDRSRRLVKNIRTACGAYLQGTLSERELIERTHLLKHSMRSDVGIIDDEYESDLNEVARRLGKVDDWRKDQIEKTITL